MSDFTTQEYCRLNLLGETLINPPKSIGIREKMVHLQHLLTSGTCKRITSVSYAAH